MSEEVWTALDSPRDCRGDSPGKGPKGLAPKGSFREPNASSRTRPCAKLTDIPEQRVLKAGIVRLHRELVANRSIDVRALPTRKDGSPVAMQASFLRRLLSNEIELKVCMEGDVSAAQMDLRYLSLEQLLTVRVHNLDFTTASENYSSHRNFLATTDMHMSEKLVRHLVRGSLDGLTKVWQLRTLGMNVLVTFGVVEVLENGWEGRSRDSSATVPSLWALKLDEVEGQVDGQVWRAAILHTGDDAWLQALPGEDPNFAGPTAGNLVAVVSDRSVGTGRDRILNWEIFAFNPLIDNILFEMLQKEGVEWKKHTDELSAVIAQRCSNRMDVLGLTTEKQRELQVASPQQPIGNLYGKVSGEILRMQGSPTPVRWKRPRKGGSSELLETPQPVEELSQQVDDTELPTCTPPTTYSSVDDGPRDEEDEHEDVDEFNLDEKILRGLRVNGRELVPISSVIEVEELEDDSCAKTMCGCAGQRSKRCC